MLGELGLGPISHNTNRRIPGTDSAQSSSRSSERRTAHAPTLWHTHKSSKSKTQTQTVYGAKSRSVARVGSMPQIFIFTGLA